MNSIERCLVVMALTYFLAGCQSITSNHGESAGIHPVALRCEYRQNPLGIDDSQPRLSWRVESAGRGQGQLSYRVLVASSAELLAAGTGDLWDSNRVASRQTNQIEYEGQPLNSRQVCYWKVRVWDRNGVASAWSQPASWSMGLLGDDDWIAKYISYRDNTPIHNDRDSLYLPAARQYRKEFVTEKKIKRATLYATALGIYEMELNSRRVGDSYFAPGWTDYHQRAYYFTYDVTDHIQPGPNAIGATVADGWYSGYVAYGLLVKLGTEQIGRYCYGKTPALMAQLEIDYEDGSRQVVGTDESWRLTGAGPFQEADLLMGETYDARRELSGWSTAGFDDQDWEHAIRAEDNGRPKAMFYSAEEEDGSGATPKIVGRQKDLGFVRPRLEAYPGPRVRLTQEIKPVEIVRRGEGQYIFNLGQNMAGTIRLKLRGENGHQVKLRYGEMLHTDGSLMTENLRRARATDSYTCKGDAGGETYSPRFTSHGFQYVEVTNFPGEPTTDSLTGLVLHSDTPLTSTFECSDPMVNQLYSNIVWTQRANFIELPTDCPQRDERMGWTGDAQVYIGAATYNADVAAFFNKWLRELMEAQFPNGAFPGFAPMPFHRGFAYGTGWADAGVICPWAIWQAYGDTRVIERCWDPMTRFMQWRQRESPDYLGVIHGTQWGDWLTQGAKTPVDYIDTVYFAITSDKMAQMAEAIGREDEAEFYRDQFQKIKRAFGVKYLRDDGSLAVDTQTAYALALDARLIPDSLHQATGAIFAQKISQNGNRMTTGFIGTRPLLPALSAAGQHDLASFLFQSHEFPSWGYEVDQGATSIWERWDSYTKEDGFGRHNAGMNSFSHYAFGAVCEWMFRTLAGIETDGPGYHRIIIRPNPPTPGSNAEHEPIHWVKASYDSIHGKIVSDWKIEGDRFLLNVTVPANTSATVYVPAGVVSTVTENGRPLELSSRLRVLGVRAGRVIIEVGSGSYAFESVGGLPEAKETIRLTKVGLTDNQSGE